MTIFAVGAAGDHRNISEGAIVIVVEQDAGFRIHGDINIRPAVVVKIIGDGSNGIARPGLEDSGFRTDVCKSAIPIVVEQNVGVSR